MAQQKTWLTGEEKNMTRKANGSTRQFLGWLQAILVLMVLVPLALSAFKAAAQTSTGSITGTVEDTQGAVISGAAVTIRNVDTNETLVLKSDESGLYAASALAPGNYEVDVARQGFEDEKITGVAVNIAAATTVNVKMKVGSATVTVQVEAEAQLIDQTSPTITAAVPAQISASIPLPERSALETVMLAPGVQGDPQYNMGIQSENTPIYTQPTTPGGSLAVGGGRPGSAMQLVDGVDLSMVGYPRVGITFSGDDVEQITVQSGAISSKYGRSGGGIINQASKSGTIEYHGKAAFRHQDPFFEATTYGQGTFNFTSASGSTITLPVTQDIHQNMFTGTFGGPVPVPLWRMNKNTFFFASFEPLRGGQKVWSRQRVPTPAELSGNFTNTYTILNTTILSTQGYAAAIAAPRVGDLEYQFPLNSNGFPNGLHDSSSASYVPICNVIPANSTGYGASQLPCATDPTSGARIINLAPQLAQNSFAKYVLSQIPNGTNTSDLNYYNSQGTYATDATNALGARGVVNHDNRYNIRVDENLGKSDHAFLRFTDVPVTGVRFAYMGPTSVLDNQPQQNVDSQTALLDYTHVIRGNAVNDVRYSFTRMNYNNEPAPATLTEDFAGKNGLTPAVMGAGFPSLSLDSGSFGSSTGGNDGGVSVNEIFSLGDDYSVVVGKHNLQFGGEWRAMQLDRLPNSGIYGGSYSFSAGNTNNGSAGGNATASFILGSINGLTLSAAQEFYYRYKYAGFYFMDSWKILPKLTLDLGLRYHLEFPRTEKYGLQGSFLPGVTGTLNNIAATGAFAFSGHNGLPTTLYPVNYNGWEPRLGFAYAVNSKTTVRGSFNLMHAPMTGVSNTNVPALTPNSLTIGGASGGASSSAWVNYITNPVSLPSTGVPGILKPPTPFFSYGTGTLPYVSQSNVVPYTINWSLSAQYQLSQTAMVQAAYVGMESHHMFSAPEATNILPLGTIESEISSNYNFSATSVPATYFPTTNVNANSNSLPYPQFYNNPILASWVRESSSKYSALYLNGMEHLRQGFTVISSFTWAKSLDDGSSGTEDGIVVDIFGFVYPQTPFAKQNERSYSTFDIPAHWTAGYTWDVPLGRGKLLNVQNHLLNELVGGLHTSGMFNAESGYPFWVNLGSVGYFCSNSATKYCGNGNAISTGIGQYNIRPNIVPGQKLILGNWRSDPFNKTGSGGYINPAAFTTPGSPGVLGGAAPTPAFGNAPRILGNARSPHTIYFDMSGTKDFPIKSDRVIFSVRADAINIFNHTNFFVNPNSGHAFDGSINSTTGAYTLGSGFGILNSANNNPGRTFALGGSVTF
jgi:hypothetical protein